MLASVVAAAAPAGALGDGDPASDVLLGASVFYPYSPPVSAMLVKALNSETAAAARAHFAIKVALISSPVDLGAIPSLFGKPQQYAEFLDQEISFLNSKELLLVVMPSGYGTAGLSSAAAAALAGLSKPAGSAGNYLAQAAIAAVPKLAAAAGHPLGAVTSSGRGGSGSSGGGSAAPIIAVVVAAIAVAGSVIFVRRRRARRP